MLEYIWRRITIYEVYLQKPYRRTEEQRTQLGSFWQSNIVYDVAQKTIENTMNSWSMLYNVFILYKYDKVLCYSFFLLLISIRKNLLSE